MSGMITLYSSCRDCQARDTEIARLKAENERLREKARAKQMIHKKERHNAKLKLRAHED